MSAFRRFVLFHAVVNFAFYLEFVRYFILDIFQATDVTKSLPKPEKTTRPNIVQENIQEETDSYI